MAHFLDFDGLSYYLDKLKALFVKKTDIMGGATSSAAGASGLVPTPASGNQVAYLRGDATWAIPTNTTYGVVTTSANGLAPQLNGNVASYLNGTGGWSVPTNTTYGVVTTAANGLAPKLNGNAGSYLNGNGGWTVPTNTTYAVVTTAANGLAPKLNGNAGSYLNGNGAWSVPTNTTYANMGAATASSAGKAGLVPAPGSGKQASFLRGDATWAVPTNTTYGNVQAPTSSANGVPGLVPSLGSAYFDTRGYYVLKSGGGWGIPNQFGLATSNADGIAGAVPAPSSANYDTRTTRFLRMDRTWAVPTNTWNALKAATSAANGTAGYVAAPNSAHFANRALIYLRNDASWSYLPLQNNATTTASYYALDARMGKTLNDKISVIGTIQYASMTTAKTVSNSWTNLVGVTLDAGTWCVTAYAQSATNQQGKSFGIKLSSGNFRQGAYCADANQWSANVVDVLTFTAQTTLYVSGWAGSSMSIGVAGITAVRLK